MSWQVALYIGIAALVALFGRGRGLNFWLIWFLSVGFTPVGGLIIVWIFGNADYEPSAREGRFDINDHKREQKDQDLRNLRESYGNGQITNDQFDRGKREIESR